MRDALTTAGELVGFGVAAAGFAMLSVPIGVVFAGLALVFVSAMAGRK